LNEAEDDLNKTELDLNKISIISTSDKPELNNCKTNPLNEAEDDLENEPLIENVKDELDLDLILEFTIVPNCDTPDELNLKFEKAWSDIADVDESFKFRNWCEMYTTIQPVFTPDGKQNGAQMHMKSKAHALCMKRVLYEKMEYLKQRGWEYWHDNDPDIEQIHNLKTNYMDM